MSYMIMISEMSVSRLALFALTVLQDSRQPIGSKGSFNQPIGITC